MFSMKSRLMVAAIAVLFVGASGCGGPQRGEMAGEVTLDGQPIQGGEIRFLPDLGPPAYAEIIEGRYCTPAAKGPGLGVARVEVRWVRKTGKQVPAMPPAPAGTMIDEKAECIPERFNRRSELRADVRPGKNVCNFELTSK